MSTENEADAATAAADPVPAQSAATSGSTGDSPSPGSSAARERDDDFTLAEPAAPSDTSPSGAAPGDGARDDGAGAAPAEGREDTAVLKRIAPRETEKGTTQLRAVPAAAAAAAEADAAAGDTVTGTTASAPAASAAPAAPATDTTQQQPQTQQPQVPTQTQTQTQTQAPTQTLPAQPQPQPQPQPDVATASASDGHTGQWGGGGATPPPQGGYGAPGTPGGAGGMGDPGSHHGGTGGPQGPWSGPPSPPPPPSGRRRGPGALVAAVLAAALLAGGVGGGIGFWAADRDDSSSTTVSSDTGGGDKLNRSPKSVAGIADKALPSVVTIEAAGDGGGSTGTGFVFDEEGHILTNNHVVASAADGGKMTATFSDGKSYAAEIVGRAEGYDIAVIKLKNAGDRKLKPLPLGDSDGMKVGDATIAIGAPFGLSGTVTTGIVSAQDRPVAASGGEGGDASYMNALQTDASINPGNSGGPLLDAKGAVIGVNSAIRSGGGGGMGEGQTGSVGLGFAIPINQAKRVASQLIETGVPVYPMIGVRVQLSEKPSGGAAIADSGSSGDPVTEGGPADKAGLRPGDVITEFDGRAIDSGPTLIATIWTHEPGETVKVTYERGGEKRTTDLTLGSQKGDT